MSYGRAVAAGVLLGVMATSVGGGLKGGHDTLTALVAILVVIVLLVAPDAAAMIEQRRKGD